MISLTAEDETVLDLLEQAAQYNALPADQRARPPVIQLMLDKARWFSLLALKEMNYRGLGEFLVLEPNAVLGVYKNIQVVYNGVEGRNYDNWQCTDLARQLRECVRPTEDTEPMNMRVEDAYRPITAHPHTFSVQTLPSSINVANF